MFRLDGRTALVTGASQGIGAGVARRLAAAGARVVLAARSREKLEALAREIESAGGRAHVLELDLAAAETIADRVATVPEELLPIGILVNNAGITADNLILRMPSLPCPAGEALDPRRILIARAEILGDTRPVHPVVQSRLW